MDNNTIPDPSGTPAQKQKYQTLGKKVFWLFFLQVSPITLIFLIISVILFVFSFQPFSADTLFGNIQNYALSTSLILFVFSLLIAIISLIYAWLTYINYVFLMAEDSFKIKRGILSKTEDAIPYHQIQNVDIERSFMFQMLGLSRLIILTAGHEDESPKGGDEAEGVISAIDKEIAGVLQSELLRRANVQKVTETK
jgi:uncharacterized membrane protein YdbT with pleckstrin-like domain